MGSQIAQILSQVGAYEVQLVDIDEELVKKGYQDIEVRLERFFVSKGKITADEKEEILSRIKLHARLEEGVKEADFIIEAVAENLALKKKTLRLRLPYRIVEKLIDLIVSD